MSENGIFFEGYPFEFYPNETSSKLIVFLPAVRSKDIYPYYPRISWGKELSEKVNVLYIADPFQHLPEYQEPMGSWFVSPEGKFVLPDLARNIEKFALKLGVTDILFYGSSMGGFSAIVLSSLVANSKAVAECPQLFLDKHPGSKYVMDNIIDKDELSCFDVEFYLGSSKSKKIQIVCSFYDRHYFLHVVPFFNSLIGKKLRPETKIDLYCYLDSLYKEGHVSLNKVDAYEIISRELIAER